MTEPRLRETAHELYDRASRKAPETITAAVFADLIEAIQRRTNIDRPEAEAAARDVLDVLGIECDR